jgi:hypothetical protein
MPREAHNTENQLSDPPFENGRTSPSFAHLLWITRKTPLLKRKTGGLELNGTPLLTRVRVTLNLKIKLNLKMR